MTSGSISLFSSFGLSDFWLNLFQSVLEFLKRKPFLGFDVPAGQHQLGVDQGGAFKRERKSRSFFEFPDPGLNVVAKFDVAGTHLK